MGGSVESDDENTTKKGKENLATTNTLATIADDFGNVLALLQAVTFKSPRVIADPLSLRTDNRACVWFRCWKDVNLPTPPKPDPQDHIGLMGVLTNVSTMLHTIEALLSIVTAQRKAEKETKGFGNVSHQQPSASSWRRALLMEPPSRPHRLPQPTASSTGEMRWPSKPIVP